MRQVNSHQNNVSPKGHCTWHTWSFKCVGFSVSILIAYAAHEVLNNWYESIYVIFCHIFFTINIRQSYEQTSAPNLVWVRDKVLALPSVLEAFLWLWPLECITQHKWGGLLSLVHKSEYILRVICFRDYVPFFFYSQLLSLPLVTIDNVFSGRIHDYTYDSCLMKHKFFCRIPKTYVAFSTDLHLRCRCPDNSCRQPTADPGNRLLYIGFQSSKQVMNHLSYLLVVVGMPFTVLKLMNHLRHIYVVKCTLKIGTGSGGLGHSWGVPIVASIVMVYCGLLGLFVGKWLCKVFVLGCCLHCLRSKHFQTRISQVVLRPIWMLSRVVTCYDIIA